MKNKKKTIMLIMVITISMVLLTWNKSYSYKMNDIIPEEKEVERKEFGIYYQTTGEEYEEKDTFPTSGYLLNEDKTECHEYGNDNVIQNAVTQSLTNGVIDGSIIVTSQKSMYCKIYFDKDEKPTVSSFNITGKTSSGDSLSNGFTYQTSDLPITFDYTDKESDVVQYCVSEANNSDSCSWKQLNGKSGNYSIINTNDGSKTIYLYLKDKANNISTAKTTNITVDRTKPIISTFTLTGTKATGTLVAGYTHTNSIKYSGSITEINMEGYCIVDGNSCSSYTNQSKTISGSLTIGNTEGSHTVVISVKDKAGNITTQNNNITLDLKDPTILLSQKNITENTIVVTVTVADTGSSGIKNVTCTAVGNNETKTGTYNSTAKTCTFSGLKDGTQYTITGVATDASGRQVTNTINVSTNKLLPAGQKKAKEVLGVVPKGISEKLLGGMYRFVGTKDTVDNWICFGYSNVDTDCNSPSSDFMYRIIGITEDGQLKLIKNNAYAKYIWTCEDCDTGGGGYYQNDLWASSNMINELNGSFLSEYLGGTTPGSSKRWSELIETKRWLYGEVSTLDGISYSELTANQWFEIESGQVEVYSQDGGSRKVGKWTLESTSKIALMYVHDYLYSYSLNNSNDSSNTNCNSASKCESSWLFIDNSLLDSTQFSDGEWTMTAFGYDDIQWYNVFYIVRGFLSRGQMRESKHFRPVFYISTEKVKISKGSGTSSSPFIVAPIS